MALTASENLRREARVDARIQVFLVRGRRSVPLETSDVSFKGLFLCTTEPPAVRSLLRLRVALPRRTIDAHAMAVHVGGSEAARGPGVGLQFWGLAGPDRIAWDDFVRQLIQAKRANEKRSLPPPPAESESILASDHPTPSGVRIAEEIPDSTRERASSNNVD